MIYWSLLLLFSINFTQAIILKTINFHNYMLYCFTWQWYKLSLFYIFGFSFLAQMFYIILIFEVCDDRGHSAILCYFNLIWWQEEWTNHDVLECHGIQDPSICIYFQLIIL
jgi:hypothetical protein